MTRGLQPHSPTRPLPEFHTAVWTGSEMIVWGGDHSGSLLNTGGRYNPSTDSWTATSTHQRARCPKCSHGSLDRQRNDRLGRIHDGNCCLNTGGRYNPITDSWTATSTTNAPAGRGFHTAVWTGSEMIVWGGDWSSALLQHRRQIQSHHRQLDSHQHHQRALGARQSHGSVDRQRNDRLGRM